MKHYELVSGYTQLYDYQLQGLHEAGATAAEILAYCALTRCHGQDKKHPTWCYRSAHEGALITGLHQRVFSTALKNLTSKEFDKGKPILKRVVDGNGKPLGGHKGQAAVYDDVLYSALLDAVDGCTEDMKEVNALLARGSKGESQSLTKDTNKGESQSLTKDTNKGESQSLTNSSAKVSQNGAKVSQNGAKVSQNDSKGESQSLTQKRTTEKSYRKELQKGAENAKDDENLCGDPCQKCNSTKTKSSMCGSSELHYCVECGHVW